MPMPMIANGDICTIRFTKLPALRKLLLRYWKYAPITTIPTMIGRIPRSPARRLSHHSRT